MTSKPCTPQWFGTPEQNAFVFLRGSALPE